MKTLGIRKALVLLSLVMLLVAAATPALAETTIEYEVTIEEPTIGLTVINETDVKGSVARDDNKPFWVGFVNTFRNTGNIIGALSAKLDEVPEGLGNALLTTPTASGDFMLSTVEVDPEDFWVVGEDVEFATDPVEVNEINAGGSVSMMTKITFGPGTPTGSYVFPVTWTLAAK